MECFEYVNLSLMRHLASNIIRAAGITDMYETSSAVIVEKLSCVVDELSAAFEHMMPYVILASKNYDVTQLMLRHGLDPNEPERLGKRTALHLAVEENYDDLARLLIEHGADLNARDLYDGTPMHYLQSDTNTELVKLMIEKGADLNARDRDGLLPLHFALMRFGLRLVKCLLEHTKVGLSDKTDGKTLLHYALQNDDPDVVGYLFTLGADIDVRDADFKTPLYVALCQKKMDTFRLLLECGADPNLKTFDGETVLQLALDISESLDSLFSALFRAGADFNVPELGLLFKRRFRNHYKELKIANQIAKLEITENFVTPSIMEILLRTNWTVLGSFAFQSFRTFGYVDCKAELEQLKEIKFYKDFSMLDILTQPDDKLMNLFKCKYIERLYTDCRSKMEDCNVPLYFQSIDTTVKRIFAKIGLVKSTEKILNDTLPLHIPRDGTIVDRIIAHMTFNDMQILFRLADPFSTRFSYPGNPYYYRF